MLDRSVIRPTRSSTLIAASLAALALALAACSSASPSQSQAASDSAAASPSQVASESVAASPSASQGVARCEVTPDAAVAATITIQTFAFDGEATISAGQGVEFHNADSVAHTITEGTEGAPVSGACVNKGLGELSRTVVTFNEPGDYQITCRIHPGMQTVVHVQ